MKPIVEMSMDQLLAYEQACREEFRASIRERERADDICKAHLDRLLEAKRILRAKGFDGNVMRDGNGERLYDPEHAVDPRPKLDETLFKGACAAYCDDANRNPVEAGLRAAIGFYLSEMT